MKKFFAISLCSVFCVVITLLSLYNFSSKENLISQKEVLLDNNKGITRAEATEKVMRAIGMTDNLAEQFTFSTYSHLPAEDVRFFEECPQMGFIYAALTEAQIVQTDENNFFYPNRYITIKEVCNMLVMCLQKEWVNCDDSLKIARQKKIIIRSDSFYHPSDNEYATQENFDILLHRFGKQKRYKYYNEIDKTRPDKMDLKTSTQVSLSYGTNLNFDDERSITYDEFAELSQTD